MTTALTTETVQVYRIYIKASAQRIWDAITQPDWSEKYGYSGRVDFDLRPGGAFKIVATGFLREAGMPEIVVDGEVLECDPPHKLVQTWRAGWDTEPATTLTYVIKEDAGVSCLTVTHDLTDAPRTAAQVAGTIEGAGGGWAEVLSDLKTLLETGSALHSQFHS